MDNKNEPKNQADNVDNDELESRTSRWINKKLNKIIIILVLSCTLLFSAAFAIHTFIPNWLAFLPSVETRTEIDFRGLEASVQQIAKLATLTYHYTEIGIFSERTFFSIFGMYIGVPGTSKSFTMVYDGEILLGVDASQITIDVQDRVVFITLPEAIILSHVIHEDSVQVLDEHAGIFNRMSISDYPDFIAMQKQEKEESIAERGLPEQARINAQEAISSFLMAFPGIAGEYTLQFN